MAKDVFVMFKMSAFTRTATRKPGIEATITVVLPGFVVLLTLSLNFSFLT